MEIDPVAAAQWNGVHDVRALAKLRQQGRVFATAVRGESALLVRAEFWVAAEGDPAQPARRRTLFDAIAGLLAAARSVTR